MRFALKTRLRSYIAPVFVFIIAGAPSEESRRDLRSKRYEAGSYFTKALAPITAVAEIGSKYRWTALPSMVLVLVTIMVYDDLLFISSKLIDRFDYKIREAVRW